MPTADNDVVDDDDVATANDDDDNIPADDDDAVATAANDVNEINDDAVSLPPVKKETKTKE